MLRILKISTLVSVVLLLNAVTTLLFVQNAVPAVAGPQSGNCVTGDVNGDFTVDITDPIHLLGYIFEGTPEPIACAQNQGAITAAEMEAVINKFMPRAQDYFKFELIEPANLPQAITTIVQLPLDKWSVLGAIDQIGPVTLDAVDPDTGLELPETGWAVPTSGNLNNAYIAPPGTARVYPPGTELHITFPAGLSFSSGYQIWGHYLNRE